jgi:hypothetical protein
MMIQSAANQRKGAKDTRHRRKVKQGRDCRHQQPREHQLPARIPACSTRPLALSLLPLAAPPVILIVKSSVASAHPFGNCRNVSCNAYDGQPKILERFLDWVDKAEAKYLDETKT